MSDYAVTIPTVLPERECLLGKLLSQLAVLCGDVPIAVSPHLAGEPTRSDTVRALERGAAFGCAWTVYLEDDAFLAPVFHDMLQACVAEAVTQGVRVVNLYSDNRRVLTAMAQGRTWCRLPGRLLRSTVCTAVRTEDVPAIAAHSTRWYAANPQHWHASDLLLAAFYARLGADALLAVPSPVQHRDPPSTLGHFVRGPRRSRSFRRAFGPIPPDG